MYYKDKFIYLENYDCTSTLSIQEIQANLVRRTERRKKRVGKRPSHTKYFEGEIYKNHFILNPIIYGTYRFPTTPFKIHIEGKMKEENETTFVSVTMKISVFILVFLAVLIMIVEFIAYPVVFLSESTNYFARAVFFTLPFLMTFFTLLTTYWIVKKQVAKHTERLDNVFKKNNSQNFQKF